jgi:hypothetical protein
MAASRHFVIYCKNVQSARPPFCIKYVPFKTHLLENSTGIHFHVRFPKIEGYTTLLRYKAVTTQLATAM